jgi:histidine triad (HIT) family protein
VRVSGIHQGPQASVCKNRPDINLQPNLSVITPKKFLPSGGVHISYMADECIFCAIAQGSLPASIVYENELALAVVDLRQFRPGHTLIIPRQHFHDVRELDDTTGAAVMGMVSRVTRAVGCAFPNQGLSLWHSIGEAAFQEVPHLHIHIHPRFIGDNVLRVYRELPANQDRATLDSYAEILRAHLD